MFTIDFINILLAIVGTITLSFGFVVFLTETVDRKNKSFFYFILSVFSWDLTMFMYRGVDSIEAAVFWARLLYLSASTIALTFLILSYILTNENYKFSNFKKILFFLPYLLIVTATLLPNGLILDVNFIDGKENIIIFDFILHVLYSAHFTFFATWAFINFFRKFLKTKGVEHTQLRYVIIGNLITATLGVSFNLFLPLYGIFTFNWAGQITILALVSAIFYAMMKHGLFNSKIISTEIFVFILWALLVGRAIFSTNSREFVLDLILIIGAVILGAVLIRSVIKEVKTREQLAIVNVKLERLNLEKSEFLSIATHQLKAPLTVIKGYVSLLMEGSYGAFTDKAKETLTKVFDSAENLIIIIEDFLNVSRIEQGRMAYQFGPVDMKKLASDITEELKHIAKRTETEISFYVQNEAADYTITADYGKTRQVLINLIDNAIKYTGKGFTKITLEKDDSKKIVRVIIKDNGIGMSKATIAKLFQRFSRAKDIGRQAQTKSGSGLGLYIAREIVLAHGGRVWAESPGEGKGSIFFLELPFIPPKNENIEVIDNITTYT